MSDDIKSDDLSGSVWIREYPESVSFYRVKYGEKKKRVLNVKYEEVMQCQHEIRKLFKGVDATNSLLSYFKTFESRHKNKQVVKKKLLTRKEIIEAFEAIGESLAAFVKEDPKCLKPENRQLGYGVWIGWTNVRPHINTIGGWNIRLDDAQKALGLGSKSRKKEEQDGQET